MGIFLGARGKPARYLNPTHVGKKSDCFWSDHRPGAVILRSKVGQLAGKTALQQADHG